MEKYKAERASLDSKKQGEGHHPRSVAQIRRARSMIATESNEPKATGVSVDAADSSPNLSSLELTSTYHANSIANLCPASRDSSEINVVCSWKVDRSGSSAASVRGQHHLRKLAVRPAIKSKGCPLAIIAKYESAITHNFTDCPLVRSVLDFMSYCTCSQSFNLTYCFYSILQTLDMVIIIYNRLMQSQVSFEFSLLNRPEVEFLGSVSFTCILNPGEDIEIPIQAMLFSSGVYDLQCVQLAVIRSDGTKVPYVFPLQWIVTINASN